MDHDGSGTISFEELREGEQTDQRRNLWHRSMHWQQRVRSGSHVSCTQASIKVSRIVTKQ